MLHEEKLFKQPPPLEDCPICFLLLPSLQTGRTYMSCCGKVICSGCANASVYDDQGNEVDSEKCPFCRTPTPYTAEEAKEREKKRVEANDAEAIFDRGCNYRDGIYGLPQDYSKALTLWHRAGDLGHAGAYCNIGYSYNDGRGVELDKKKAEYYWELSAIAGGAVSRYNLGLNEVHAGNINRAIKHFLIAARGGDSESVKQIQLLYSLDGVATKEDYAKALHAYQTYLSEIKSAERDEAAAACEYNRYY